MQDDKRVSLWLGTVASASALDAIVAETYSDDGDFLGSQFSRAFGIEYYDEDFREAEFREQPSGDLAMLLRGFSSDDVIVPRFKALADPLAETYNAVVLLYNFAYDGSRNDWQEGNVAFRYVGSVAYR